MSSAPAVVVVASSPGPIGPVALVATAMTVIVDGGGSVILPGVKADLPVPFDGEIVGWELIGDLAGDVEVDILRGRPVDGVPFAGITGGAANRPKLTAVAADDGDALGWDVVLSNGDALRYSVISAQTVRRLTIAIFVERA